jgi:hypothetical protein
MKKQSQIMIILIILLISDQSCEPIRLPGENLPLLKIVEAQSTHPGGSKLFTHLLRYLGQVYRTFRQ